MGRSQDQVLRVTRFMCDPVVGHPSAAGVTQRQNVYLIRILLDRSPYPRQHLLGQRRVDQTLKDALLYTRTEIEQNLREPLTAAVVRDDVTVAVLHLLVYLLRRAAGFARRRAGHETHTPN